jgi:hypothetical protein
MFNDHHFTAPLAVLPPLVDVRADFGDRAEDIWTDFGWDESDFEWDA